MTEALTCGCVPTESNGYDPANCQIHGPGGLRDQQQEALAKWKRAHPIRAILWQLEYDIRQEWRKRHRR